MTWLHSLVFAGLLFSTNGETWPEYSYLHTLPATPAETRPQGDEIEKFTQSYPISPNGRVSVSNVNGSIEMVAWDRNEVRLEATKIADSREALADVEIKVDSRPDHFTVEADYKDQNWHDRPGSGKYRKLEVQFRLSVPRTASLNEIETVNGSVTANNFVNLVRISAVNGGVNASNLRGNATLSTVNGTVTADFDRLEKGTKVNLDTVNGRVNLSIPSDANATIKADSLNGNITNNFGLPVRKGEYVGRDLYGRLGSGEVQIRLNSVNGPLAITRKEDGRSPSPATNLLPAKREAEDSWDDDTSERAVDAQQINREVQRAVREAERTSAAAMREATRELSKVKLPELEKLKTKVDVDGRKLDESIKAGLKVEAEALARVQEALWLGNVGTVERRTNSFTVKNGTKVSIDARNCNVKVRGWDKPEVKYVLTEMAGSGRSTVKESQRAGAVDLTVTSGLAGGGGFFPGEDDRTRLEVWVPRNTDLKISTKGEVRLEGVSGDLNILGGQNSIDVRNAQGKLNVVNSDGIVRVAGFRGDVTARTGSGEVYLDGDFNAIEGKVADGKIVLTLPVDIDADIQAPADSVVANEIVSGKRVSDSAYRLGKGGRTYKFTTADGTVELRSRESLGSER